MMMMMMVMVMVMVMVMMIMMIMIPLLDIKLGSTTLLNDLRLVLFFPNFIWCGTTIF